MKPTLALTLILGVTVGLAMAWSASAQMQQPGPADFRAQLKNAMPKDAPKYLIDVAAHNCPAGTKWTCEKRPNTSTDAGKCRTSSQCISRTTTVCGCF
jgi:hypothetical protein